MYDCVGNNNYIVMPSLRCTPTFGNVLPLASLEGAGAVSDTCTATGDTHMPTRTHARTHGRTHAHTHTRTHAHTHARMDARTHTRTHAHIHTHTHQYKHTNYYTMMSLDNLLWWQSCSICGVVATGEAGLYLQHPAPDSDVWRGLTHPLFDRIYHAHCRVCKDVQAAKARER